MPVITPSEVARLERAITKNLTTLCDKSVNIEKVIRSLIESEVMDDDQGEEIVNQKNKSSRFYELYMLLKKKLGNPTTYPAMVKALNSSGNEAIVTILKNFENNYGPVQTSPGPQPGQETSKNSQVTPDMNAHREEKTANVKMEKTITNCSAPQSSSNMSENFKIQKSEDLEDVPMRLVTPTEADVTDSEISTQLALPDLTYSTEIELDKPKKTGSVLIINNTFQGDSDERRGSAEDVRAMKELFGFIATPQCVSLVENVTTDLPEYTEDQLKTDKQLSVVLKKFQKDCKERKSDYCVVIFMTHGGPSANSLKMADSNHIDLFQDLVYKFNNNNLDFKGREKIFFIQACQDYRKAYTLSTSGASSGIELDGNGSSVTERSMTDIFIGYSCLPRTGAYRHIENGSFYIQAIKTVFSKNFRKMKLQDMHDMVWEDVSRKCRLYNLLHRQEPDFHGYKFKLFCF